MRYWYANGRPSRVEAATVSNDLQTLNYYTTYYIEYNWHGDATNFVTSDGIGGNNAILYNPWGNGMNTGPAGNYYGWDGGWGYLSFPSLGLYYVHGRWYNPDIGRFISPDAKGDYRYGSGDDAINSAWLRQQPQLGNGDYSCNVATGCNVAIPITAECGPFACLLNAGLDRAIQFYAGIYGIPPDLVAATQLTELVTDWQPHHPLKDWVLSMAASNPSNLASNAILDVAKYSNVGPHEIHLNTARAVEGYFQRHYPNTAMANLLTSAPTTSTLILMLLSTDGNIRYSAAYLRELADDRIGSREPHLNDLTLTDKQIIYGAYRNGEGSYGQISDFRGAQIPGVSGQKARFALILYGNYYR